MGKLHSPVFTVAALVAFSLASTLAQADSAVPRQPLSDALRALGDRWDYQIAYYPPLVEGLEVEPAGEGEPFEAALAKLLAGTGLVYKRVEKKQIYLMPVGEEPAEPSEEKGAPVGSRGAPAKWPAAEETTIVVTGTHIRGITPSASPLYSLDANGMRRLGIFTTPEFSRRYLQSFELMKADSAVNGGNSLDPSLNIARGVGLNIHGFAPGATLVLLNNHRLALGGADGSFADISLIPLNAISRIEAVPDGTSAVYGSDAVAGTVNFLIRDDVEGAETALTYGDTERGGVSGPLVSQLLGHQWDAGAAMLAYEYQKQSPLEADHRSFIRPQADEFMVFPAQARSSFIGTFHQQLKDTTTVRGDVLFSERSFNQRYVTDIFSTQGAGSARQLNVAVELEQRLPNSLWSATLSANHAIHKERVANLSAPLGTPLSGDADVFASSSAFDSMDLRADGPLFADARDGIKLSVGAGLRQERFNEHSGGGNAATDLSRDVMNVYGELHIPLWARRVNLSAAVRYDGYHSADASAVSSVNPKIGVVWSPVDIASFRATYSTGFANAPLARLSEQANSAMLISLDSADGPRNGLLLFGGNRSLEPERSESVSLGVDLQWPERPGSVLSISYFDVNSKGRIGAPPVRGAPSQILSQYDRLSPFINASPTAAEVQSIYSRYPVSDQGQPGTQQVDLIFDGRFQNIAEMRSRGLDLTGNWAFEIGRNRLQLSMMSTYLLGLDCKTSAMGQRVRLVDTAFHPVDFRFQGGLSWESGPYASSLLMSFYDSYVNNTVTPEQSVSGWQTVDAFLSFDSGKSDALATFLGRAVFSMSVNNVMDRDPPRLDGNLDYDPTNASPLGRSLSVRVMKHW
jgi:outer membrane receptor protein involved in Fe transport